MLEETNTSSKSKQKLETCSSMAIHQVQMHTAQL
jgi:hypothetical protein